MVRPSIGKEHLLIKKLCNSIPEGSLKVEYINDCMSEFKVEMAAHIGPYRGQKFVVNVEMQNKMQCWLVIENPSGPIHPNFGGATAYTVPCTFPMGCTIASCLDFLLHFLNYPMFDDSCVFGRHFGSDKDVNNFLKEIFPSWEDNYPYFQDKSLQRSYEPNLDYVLPGHVTKYERERKCLKFADDSKETYEQWYSSSVNYSIDILFEEETRSAKLYRCFEHGMREKLPGYAISTLSSSTEEWTHKQTIKQPLARSTLLGCTELNSSNSYLCYQGRIGYRVNSKCLDVYGKNMPMFPLDSTNATGIENDLCILKFENAFMNKFIDKTVPVSNWPAFLAPGSCLSKKYIEITDYPVDMADGRRVSSYCLLSDIMKLTRQIKDQYLRLLDPMTMSVHSPIICDVIINENGDLLGYDFISTTELYKSPSYWITHRGWLLYLKLLSTAFLTLCHNIVGFLSRLEINAQLGLSRPPHDCSLPHVSVHQSGVVLKHIPSFANSVPLLDSSALFFTAKAIKVLIINAFNRYSHLIEYPTIMCFFPYSNLNII